MFTPVLTANRQKPFLRDAALYMHSRSGPYHTGLFLNLKQRLAGLLTGKFKFSSIIANVQKKIRHYFSLSLLLDSPLKIRNLLGFLFSFYSLKLFNNFQDFAPQDLRSIAGGQLVYLFYKNFNDI